jgi:hypothetical protein
MSDPNLALPDPEVLLAERDQAATERDQAKSASATLEREVAFLRAGVDTTTDAGRMLMRGYDGELTPEKIKEAAQSFGIGQPAQPANEPLGKPAPPPNPTLEPGEANLTAERNDLGSQPQPDQGLVADPYEDAMQLGRDIISDGGKYETGIGAAINFLAARAQDGDSRVIIDRRSLQGQTPPEQRSA